MYYTASYVMWLLISQRVTVLTGYDEFTAFS